MYARFGMGCTSDQEMDVISCGCAAAEVDGGGRMAMDGAGFGSAWEETTGGATGGFVEVGFFGGLPGPRSGVGSGIREAPFGESTIGGAFCMLVIGDVLAGGAAGVIVAGRLFGPRLGLRPGIVGTALEASTIGGAFCILAVGTVLAGWASGAIAA